MIIGGLNAWHMTKMGTLYHIFHLMHGLIQKGQVILRS